MIMTHTYANDQGQRSVRSKDRVEIDEQMNRQMEAIALPPVLMRLVKITNITLRIIRQRASLSSFKISFIKPGV